MADDFLLSPHGGRKASKKAAEIRRLSCGMKLSVQWAKQSKLLLIQQQFFLFILTLNFLNG
jgi:hypothetical protein